MRTDTVSGSTVQEFPRKNIRKPTEATANSQLLELNRRHSRMNSESKPGKRGEWVGRDQFREWGKGVNSGSGVCQSLLQPNRSVMRVISADMYSKAVNLTAPFFCIGTFRITRWVTTSRLKLGWTQRHTAKSIFQQSLQLLLPWQGERGNEEATKATLKGLSGK